MNALTSWWRARADRERHALVAGAVVLAAMLVWAFAWKPLADARSALVAGNARLAADLSGMRAMAARAGSLAAGDAVARDRAGQSLLALADAGLRETGLAGGLARIEPAGSGRVRLRLEAIAFDPLADWLQRLHQHYGIRIAELAVTRTDAGRVDANLLIEDP